MRGHELLNGIIIVDKPSGWTSFDVVAKIRNVSGARKVGHSGTLDPMATGVLPLFLGSATKQVNFFLNGNKGYEGEMILGMRTDTGDVEGKALTPLCVGLCSDVPFPLPEGEGVREIFKKYTGEIMQIPPMYSAVKIKGKRLYELARKGIEVKREPRKITIYDLQFISFEVPVVKFSVLCSKGTYIRQLAMDIGDDLGCGACLSKLVRTYSHPFHISQALSIETIVTMAKMGELAKVLISPEEVRNEY